MQMQQPWRLMCSGALTTAAGLIFLIMARTHYQCVLFWFAAVMFIAGAAWLIFEILRIPCRLLRI